MIILRTTRCCRQPLDEYNPRGITCMITNMMPVLGIDPVLPTMHCENIAKFVCWIQTLTTHARIEYFAAGSSGNKPW